MNNTSSKRLPYIDNIKGFGMLLVVFGHVLYELSSPEAFEQNKLMDFIESFYMKMFFFYSGFVFVFKDELGIVQFVVKSFKSLIYPCLIFFFIDFIVGRAFLNYLGKGNFSIKIDTLINFYWFCKCLFASKVFLYLFLKIEIYVKNLYLHKYVNYFSLSCLLIAVQYLLPNYLQIPWGFKTIHIFYVLGFLIKMKSNHMTLLFYTRANCIFIIIVTIMSIIILNVIKYFFYWDNQIIGKLVSLINPFLMIILVHFFFKKYNREVIFLTKFGQLSLLIYLIHIVIISWSFKILDCCLNREVLFSNFIILISTTVILSVLSLKIATIINNNLILRKFFLLK